MLQVLYPVLHFNNQNYYKEASDFSKTLFYFRSFFGLIIIAGSWRDATSQENVKPDDSRTLYWPRKQRESMAGHPEKKKRRIYELI